MKKLIFTILRKLDYLVYRLKVSKRREAEIDRLGDEHIIQEIEKFKRQKRIV